MVKPQWLPPPTDWHLGESDLHLWAFSLNRTAFERQQFWQTLTDDEQQRANRFYFEIHKHHFIAARGLLRLLLSNYLFILPTAVHFNYGPNGKPHLDDRHRVKGRMLKFNLSHAQEMGVIGVCWGRELGVDIEKIRPLDDGPQIARRFFSDWEVERFFAVPETKMPEAFFNGWTRKEAFIKAIGDGLSYPLNKFDVTLTPGQKAELVRVEGSQLKASHWELTAYTPEHQYTAALMVERADWNYFTFRWPDAP